MVSPHKSISSVCSYITASTVERHAEGSIPFCTVPEPQHNSAVNSPASGAALLPETGSASTNTKPQSARNCSGVRQPCSLLCPAVNASALQLVCP